VNIPRNFNAADDLLGGNLQAGRAGKIAYVDDAGSCTYGELADLAGYPGAARAVGSVMSSNRYPIIIPCHRVVGSAGSLGGFSAPQGISLKERMLTLEGASPKPKRRTRKAK